MSRKFNLVLSKDDYAKEEKVAELRTKVTLTDPKSFALQLYEQQEELEKEGYTFDIKSGFLSVHKDGVLLFKKDRFIYFGVAYD